MSVFVRKSSIVLPLSGVLSERLETLEGFEGGDVAEEPDEAIIVAWDAWTLAVGRLSGCVPHLSWLVNAEPRDCAVAQAGTGSQGRRQGSAIQHQLSRPCLMRNDAALTV